MITLMDYFLINYYIYIRKYKCIKLICYNYKFISFLYKESYPYHYSRDFHLPYPR